MPHAAPSSPWASFAKTVPPHPLRPLGVTMRQLPQEKTGDVHDALSADWGRFLAAAGLRWLPLPNRGEETLVMAQMLDLGGIIFSGGGDVGQEPARDATEGLLLQWARRHHVPVLGVCRGFQALQWHLGGELVFVCGHVATRHLLWKAEAAEADELPALEQGLYRRTAVNSFHNMGIERLAAPLTPLALSRDAAGGWHVEAARAEGLLGLMWHPERGAIPCLDDLVLLQCFFKGCAKAYP